MISMSRHPCTSPTSISHHAFDDAPILERIDQSHPKAQGRRGGGYERSETSSTQANPIGPRSCQNDRFYKVARFGPGSYKVGYFGRFGRPCKGHIIKPD